MARAKQARRGRATRAGRERGAGSAAVSPTLHTVVYATIGGSGSVVGMALVLWKETLVRRWSVTAVAFAAGAMATTAFAHLFPEALEASATAAPLWVIAGFETIFVLKQMVSFHACGQVLSHLIPET